MNKIINAILGNHLSKAMHYSHYSVYFSRAERREIEKCFSRAFASDEGKKALAYLQYITFQRALPADSDPKLLSYAEGQRALVGNILKLVENGKK